MDRCESKTTPRFLTHGVGCTLASSTFRVMLPIVLELCFDIISMNSVLSLLSFRKLDLIHLAISKRQFSILEMASAPAALSVCLKAMYTWVSLEMVLKWILKAMPSDDFTNGYCVHSILLGSKNGSLRHSECKQHGF